LSTQFLVFEDILMTRVGAIVLVIAISFASLPAPAQNLVLPKLLPPPAALRATAGNLLNQDSSAQPTQPVNHKHWTKGGKIMTYIGVGLMAGGAGALAYGLLSLA
jgi:hypothetical protein